MQGLRDVVLKHLMFSHCTAPHAQDLCQQCDKEMGAKAFQ